MFSHMKMTAHFVVSLLLLVTCLSAQSQTDWRQSAVLPDSIKRVLDTMNVEKAPRYVYRYGHKARLVDHELGLKVYRLGIAMAEGLEDPTYYSYGFYYIARLYQRTQQFDSARYYFLKTASLARQNEDSSLLATSYEKVALDYLNRSDFSRSNDFYRAALAYTTDTTRLLLFRNKIALNFVTSGNLDSALYYQLLSEPLINQLNTPKPKGEWYWNLAIMYKRSEQPDAAVRYFKEAIAVFSTCPEIPDCNTYRKAATLLLASTFVDKESYDSAKNYFDILADDSVYMSSPQVFGFYMHQSRLYENTGQYEQAIASLLTSNRALSKQQNLNNQFGYYSNAFNIGKLYVKLEDYGAAKRYLEQSVEWFEENNNASRLAEAYENLALTNYHLRDYRAAFDIQQKQIQLADSLKKVETEKNLQELNTKYEVADREKEIALLEAETKNQALVTANQRRNVIILGVILFIVILIAAVIYIALRRFRVLNTKLNLQNEKIRQSESMKTRWFVNISHELKTPLTLIKGPVHKVLEEDTVNSVAREDLELVERNVEKLSGIVHEILDISKLENGKLRLNEKAVLLGRLIRNVVSAFDSTATGRSIKLTIDAEEDFAVKVDEGQLMKVLTNFISNALKFSPNNSEVVVELKREGDEIWISVQDQGIGIRERDLAMVFDRFYQAGESENIQQGGTGVGLSLAKEIMELHGGRVAVVSKLEEGSTFSAILPTNLLTSPPEEELQSASIREGLPDYQMKSDEKPKVLIVEDNDDMRQYLRSLLKHDYQLTEAKEGQEGLEQLAYDAPDLIISDVMMPGMDGITFARKVKSMSKFAGMPFITLTALTTEEDKLYTLKLGVDDYINKPFNAEELKTRIYNLLNNRRARQEMHDEEVVEAHDDKVLRSLEQEIQSHLNDGLLSVAYLASFVSMSERNFQRYVKKTTGFTPLQLINEIRLKKALQLLEKRAFPTVKEVGVVVGFGNASHFSDLFRKG